jgi:alpha-mannosidase
MEKRFLHSLSYSWILVLAVSCLGMPPSARGETLWRIGTFNYSSGEFNQGSAGAPLMGQRFPQGELVYVVGKSSPGKDWPAFQPGSSNGRAGFKLHPYTIEFDFASVPRGLVTLKVSLLVETPRAPSLGIEINGHRALYYRHPKLDYTGGDREMVVSPIGAADTITAEIPSGFLDKGTNKLVLAAVNEETARDDATDSGILYDAIELDQDPGGSFRNNAVTADVVPSVFYERNGNALTELVDVYVRRNAPSAHGQLTLELGGQKYTHDLSSNRDFGEDRIEFAVPEFTAGTPARVDIKMGGRPLHFPVTVNPAKKWTIYVVPHEHLDVGYTDFQPKVAEVQSRALDEAIQMIHTHPDFRYSPDGYWCIEQFLAGRTDAQRDEFLRLVKENKIFVPAQEASLLTGFASLETLIRSLSSSFQFHQKYGGSFDYANITDVPSYSWSYASILAGSGLKYFVAASDNDNGPILVRGRLHEKSPFWWEGPDGAKILMWFSRSYLQVAYLFGLPPQLTAGRDSLPIFLQAYSRPEYKSDAVFLYGTQVENTDLFPQQAEMVNDWNKLYAYPRMQFSGFSEALEHITRQLGDAIPVVKGDGGPYWEFGNASDAAYVAIERASEHRAPSAEMFSTISTLVNPVIKPDRTRLDQLWRDMVLVDEHTWTSAVSVWDPEVDESSSQIAFKENYAHEAKMDIDYLLRRHLATIAGSINDPAGTLIVFNPLTWKRSGMVEYDLTKGHALLDLTSKQEVAYEVLATGQDYLHVRFLAQDVPAVGYKCYALTPAKSVPTASSSTNAGVMENNFYRITLDPASGAVKSIFDKELNQELVNTSSPYRFDQYLYVTGGDEFPNRLQEFSSATPIPKLDIHAATGGRLVSVTREPFGTVARLESASLNTPQVSTEIMLFDDQKKIMFVNHVRKSPAYTKEAVYFSFPLMMDHPEFRYDVQNGFVDPAHDQMPGAGKEWFSVQHWVEAQQAGVNVAIVPIDAPLVTLGDIVRGTWPQEFGERSGNIFSYIMNNYYFTNWPAAQGGDFTFRYVVSSGRDLTPEYLSQLGRAEMTPLEVDEIISNDKAVSIPAPLPSDEASFLEIDQPNVVLAAWKVADDGDGMIMRFLEVGGRGSTVNVRLPQLHAESAWSCNLMEQKGDALPVSSQGFSFTVKPFQIFTVRVKGTPTL